ncbi:MAG: competence/damage-inducible protein A [Gammaproteobacteria bacterium]
MRFAGILIGDELLSGKRQDKHLPFVIETLRKRGLELAWVQMLGDDATDITAALQITMASGDAVFCFGGIGATPDDRTRQAAAQAAGVIIARHPEAVEILERRFGDDAYPNRIRMAELPQGCVLIPNPVNEIPGFSVGHHHFVPGFPDMAWPMIEWVLDRHYTRYFNPDPDREYRYRLENVPESELVPVFEELLDRFPGLRVSSLPSTESPRREIEVGIKGRAAHLDAAAELLTDHFDTLGAQWTALT